MRKAFPSAVEEVLAVDPPTHLFHYTSPPGLIGIVSSKKIWATHASFMNDTKELHHAIDYAKNAIFNRLNNIYQAQYTDEQKKLLQEMDKNIYVANRQIFLFSLSAQRDLLSQWRAYCPPGGGYAIGFPTVQLRNMAIEQGFYLAPCVYDHVPQYKIVQQIIEKHLTHFNSERKQNPLKQFDEIVQPIVQAFAEDIAYFGPILKHPAFREEHEWRLVSSPLHVGHAKVQFRANANSVVPFYEFDLVNGKYPTLTDGRDMNASIGVVVGPTTDMPAAEYAVQCLMQKNIGLGCWHSVSSAPYRGV
jgi:hypothetical protein